MSTAEVSASRESTSPAAMLIVLAKTTPGFFVASGLFLSIFIALPLAGIPWRFSLSGLLVRYVAVALQSIVYAVVLATIQFPDKTLPPLLVRYRRSPPRLIILILLGLLFFYLYPAFAAIILMVVAIAVLELYERHPSGKKHAEPLLPGAYLFIGLVAVFAYNAIIVTIRHSDYSKVFQKIDWYLTFGHTVSELSHRFCAAVPHLVTNVLMASYFALFAQIGAALILVTFLIGRDEAMRFVSTILLAYLITVVTFSMFPSYSPYVSCPDHMRSDLPSIVLQAQQSLMSQASLRRLHASIPIDTEYYVAFPCMHITQPLIVLWFLRRWRRIFFTLLVVDFVLTFAIVLLEWHYIVDLIGGVAVAAMAITISARLHRVHFESPVTLARGTST